MFNNVDLGGFQFLIGRLKTLLRSTCYEQGKMFQFLIGRLKTEPPESKTQELLEFQFLIGRLKTQNCNYPF